MNWLNKIKTSFGLTHEKEPWQIAAARYCVDKAEGLTKEELQQYIKSLYNNVGDSFIEWFFSEEIAHPSGRQYDRSAVKDVWVPPLDLVSKVTDYDELKEARKNARQAFWLSIIAIIISAITLIISFFK